VSLCWRNFIFFVNDFQYFFSERDAPYFNFLKEKIGEKERSILFLV